MGRRAWGRAQALGALFCPLHTAHSIPVTQAEAKHGLDFAHTWRCPRHSFLHLKGFPSVQTLWGDP